MISVLQAAKHLCKKSDWTLSNLEVQKILYISNMIYLRHMKKPLLEGLFQAWDYGPVHPELYHFLKYYGPDSIPELAFRDVKDLEINVYKNEANLIDQVADVFPHPSGSKLIRITHWDHGAWRKNYELGIRGKTISNSDIDEEYEKRIEDILRNQN